MDKRLSAEHDLSSALQCLHLIIVEKRAATDELHASNQELEAVLQGLLTIRGDLKAIASDGAGDVPHFQNGYAPPPNGLTLPQLKQEMDLTAKRAQDAMRDSILLRMKSKRLREALTQPNGHSPDQDQLSRRERQVLALIVAGKSSKQIAVELGISFKTAVTHRASIMGKMGVHEIASVVREAIRRGLA
jgi:DNA-binding NarL/FixJ family response regulator